MWAQLNLWLPLLSVVLALMALYLSFGSRNKLRQLHAKQLADTERMEKQLTMIKGASMGMGQRMLVLEQKLQAATPSRQRPLAETEGFSYTQAMQLFDRGVDAAAVAATCGISRSEAQLMQLIRSQMKSSNALADQ